MAYFPYTWPEGKRFAFSVFDDTDGSTLENTAEIYALLKDLGMRTTKSVWLLKNCQPCSPGGATCQDRDYLAWVKHLQASGFEVGYHMARCHSSIREETIEALTRFQLYFDHFPKVMANHSQCRENIYWGNNRFTGVNGWMYNLLTRFRQHQVFQGHVPESPYFWGDWCQEKIKYVRNFAFSDINSLKACPFMPYHDPARPFVSYWFASSKGNNVTVFNECLKEQAQDRLEEEGGACIMYVHFASRFYRDGEINPRFRFLMERLSKKNGWFVPTSTILDYLLKARGEHVVSSAERNRLERSWLQDQIRSRLKRV